MYKCYFSVYKDAEGFYHELERDRAYASNRKERRPKKRADLEGAEKGVLWDETREFIRKLRPQEHGIMCSILAEGVLSRERLFRHGRIPDGHGRCILPLCDKHELEMREH